MQHRSTLRRSYMLVHPDGPHDAPNGVDVSTTGSLYVVIADCDSKKQPLLAPRLQSHLFPLLNPIPSLYFLRRTRTYRYPINTLASYLRSTEGRCSIAACILLWRRSTYAKLGPRAVDLQQGLGSNSESSLLKARKVYLWLNFLTNSLPIVRTRFALIIIITTSLPLSFSHRRGSIMLRCPKFDVQAWPPISQVILA